KVLVVGAGVFGLSTALHLSKRGYAVHLFDYQPYHENGYAYSAGCDGASCDENKILRASYGNAKLYQDLALDRAMPEWQRWNELLSKTPAGQLPPGVTPDVPLWNNCGYLRLSQSGLEQSEVETQANFPKEIRHTQYRISDAGRRRDAEAEGVASAKIDPFGRLEKGLPTDGVLDMTGGFVLASRACAFALHLCHQAGVEAHLGAPHGLKRLMRHGQAITGIVTNDGREHHGDLVVLACGGWTPSLLPEIERLVETTAGSVLSIRLPQDRKDLWDRYSPERFPVWTWNMYGYERRGRDIGGLYGLPRTPEGVVKIAFRGAKWTNYSVQSQSSGNRLSYPKTDVGEIPEEAMRVIKTFCEENLPDLLELEL
ncbi:FAD dependent oxidoreductase-domain-containing protein, partial [Neohortaea acidophila]